MELLTRQSNESVKDFKIRLCQYKDEYGLSWSQIRDVIDTETGEKSGEDRYRKWWYVYSEGLNDGTIKQISGDEMLQEMEEKKLNLQKTKYQLQDQKRELNNTIRQVARFDHIKEELLVGLHEIAKSKPLEWKPVVKITGNREAVILLSDWHKGLFEDNFWNKLDDAEFDRRVRKLVIKTIENCKQQGAKILHALILGDMVNGFLHVQTRVSNTEDVAKQTMRVSEILAEVIAKFASEFEEVHLYFTRGNHDRMSPNMKESIDSESFAEFIPWYMKSRLTNCSNIQFHDNKYDEEIISAEVAGELILGVHGHKDKPDDAVQTLTMMVKKFPSTVVMGHYHHSREVNIFGIESIVNGCLSGVDRYAINIRKLNQPEQKLLIYERGQGRICTYNIRLDN